MTEFELALASALRDEAKEISMSTDQQSAAEELRTRLDNSDRRRHVWYTGAAAAAVVVGLILWAVLARSSGQPDSAKVADDPSSAPTIPYSASALNPRVDLELPSWTEHASHDGSVAGVARFDEGGCAGLNGASPCAADQDLKLRLVSVHYFFGTGDSVVTHDPSYAAYLAHLDGLEPDGIATISDRSDVEVGGRPGTVMSLSVLLDAPGALACARESDPAVDCMPLLEGRGARIAVVDQGAGTPPTVFYLSLNGDATDRAERFAEFDTMLASATFS